MADVAQVQPTGNAVGKASASSEVAEVVEAVIRPQPGCIVGPTDFPMTALVLSRLRSKLQQLGVIN